MSAVRVFTGPAIIFGMALLALHVLMPTGRGPASWLGSFYGWIEASDILAKRGPSIEYERDKAAAIAQAQMELEVLRHQMTTLYEAMAAQTAMANAADVFCVLGQLGSGIQNNDMRNAASAMRQSCGYGDEIRARQQAQYADLARKGAAIASRINRLKGE